MRFTGSLNVLSEPLEFLHSCILDTDLYTSTCDRKGKEKRMPVTGHKVAVITVITNSNTEW